MAFRSISTLALVGLATLSSAMPLEGETANLTARKVIPEDQVIAQILWFEGENCDPQAGQVTFYNVGTMDTHGFDPDTCDPGLPYFTDTADGNNVKHLPYRPRSFSVGPTVRTCDPDVDAGQQLNSLTLFPDCKRKVNSPTDDPSYFCPGSCTQFGWARDVEGYNKCINVPGFAAQAGRAAFSIFQRVQFCHGG